jgi:hypothetical protein
MAWYWATMMAVSIFSVALGSAALLRSAIGARKERSASEGGEEQKEFILYFFETLNLAKGEEHMTGRG